MSVLSRQRDFSSLELLAPAVATARSRAASARFVRGFTLVELMITLVVATVLLLIAVPSFKGIIASSGLTSATNDVVGALNVARMEAIKRNGSAQLCSNSSSLNTAASDTLGTQCGTNTGAVYVATGTTATKVRDSLASLNLPLQLSGNLVALRFDGSGLAYAVGSTTPIAATTTIAIICSTSVKTNNRSTIKMAAGGSIVTTAIDSGTCP